MLVVQTFARFIPARCPFVGKTTTFFGRRDRFVAKKRPAFLLALIDRLKKLTEPP
jgi:hypothetical protein